MKYTSIEDFKDTEFDLYGNPLFVILQIAEVVLGEQLEKRKLKEEDGEREVSIPKRKRSMRQGPVFPIAQPKLFKEEDRESEGLEPKKKRRRPVCPFPTPDLAKNLRPHVIVENIKVEKKLKKLKPKLKKSKKPSPRPVCPIPPPDLPENFRRHIVETMGGSGLVLVIQKALFFTDVNPSASRFSIPFSQVSTHDFLNETEAKALDDKENPNPMQVSLLDPSMMETTLHFNKWVMTNTPLYVMTKAWNSVVNNNGLEENNIVQLWSFRVNSKLCFALVKL